MEVSFLRLAATLQVAVAQIETVLIDLDVRAQLQATVAVQTGKELGALGAASRAECLRIDYAPFEATSASRTIEATPERCRFCSAESPLPPEPLGQWLCQHSDRHC